MTLLVWRSVPWVGIVAVGGTGDFMWKGSIRSGERRRQRPSDTSKRKYVPAVV